MVFDQVVSATRRFELFVRRVYEVVWWQQIDRCPATTRRRRQFDVLVWWCGGRRAVEAPEGAVRSAGWLITDRAEMTPLSSPGMWVSEREGVGAGGEAGVW